MKICFIDLLFNWPPRGGADVDVFNVMKQLSKNNHEVLLLSISSFMQNRGMFKTDSLPFPAKKITVDFSDNHSFDILKNFLLSSVSHHQPDWIIIGDCFFLKPVITLFFDNTPFPIIWRQYAYELLCQKDILKFLNNKPCPLDYLSAQYICQKCGLYHQKEKLLKFEINVWIEEYLLTKAYKSNYSEILSNALKKVQKIIVSSDTMANTWKCYHPEILIFPGGIDTEHFHIEKNKNNVTKKIFMSGRIEDTAKGFHVLYRACEKLRKKRNDFELFCTGGWKFGFPDWIKFLGWLDYEELPHVYSEMDICVVPSIWEEPFGIVALEAMATGSPVIASNIGGLRTTILHGETGFLFPPNDDETLMNYLDLLLSNDTLRNEMGNKAQSHVLNNYSWGSIITNYYEKELMKQNTFLINTQRDTSIG
ncbi:MAG: glycosyltransferase family 4 protein [Candidatus Hydrogenedens sp.]